MSDHNEPTGERLDRHVRDLVSEGLLESPDFRTASLYIPQVRWDRLSTAAFDLNGRTLARTEGFPQADPTDISRAATRQLADRGAALLVVATPDHGDGLVALARPEVARRWSAPEASQRIFQTEGARWVGLCASRIRSAEAIAEACAALKLSPMQSRVIASLIRHGDLHRAATEAVVTYATAREAVADAMKRVGATRRASLLERVVGLTLGVVPEGEKGRDLLRETWSLTPRQASLAISIAQGATRDEAACSAGVSPAVAKKELANTFAIFGVESASELSTLLSEAQAMSELACATDGALAVDRHEPIRFAARPDGGLVAYSDYGPRGAEPVLILHSSMGSRAAPSRLVAALQAQGFRPFSIDRPGFGFTDWTEGNGDPFSSACDDIRLVCRQLKLGAINLVARGGAQVAMHLAAQSPELLLRVVLVAPDPPTRISRPTSGILGSAKKAFQSNPDLIEPLARFFVSNLTTANLFELIKKNIRTSAPDIETISDPQNFRDYYRGFQMFMSGRIRGYVREQRAMVVQPDPPGQPLASHWRVLVGEHDPLHDPAEIVDYWRSLVPKADFEVLEDAGRFIVLSHPGHVAQVLRDAPIGPG